MRELEREPVEIVDVSPRDGLQAEPAQVDTGTKIELVRRLLDAGVRRLEVASFVSPTRVPQMADAEAVLAGLPRDRGASFIGLVLNRRGFDRAAAAGIDEVNFVVVASDTFNRRNQGTGTEESVAVFQDIARAARGANLPLGVTLGAAFGCPYEGEVPVDRVVDLAGRLCASGAAELALADTIGVAAPSDVEQRVAAVREVIGDTPLRCHLHNTRNTGLANAYAAYQAGVRILDASCGGIGGCPFAPRSTGNVPTEDLLYMLGRMGVPTGVELEGVIETARWLEPHLGREVPGLVTRAGPFPPRDAGPR